ncbi:MAG: glycosyltransferase family 39 protein [Bacillota bacterium]|nr:glycosyltransferase family 39 protein [Bacillota bacterium]
MKKTAAIGLALFLLFAFSSTASAAGNLIQNGDFAINTEGIPENWDTHSWIDDTENTLFYVDEGNGNNFVVIENRIKNDSAFIQRVKVEPNTMYRLSCKIKAKDVGSNTKGANISIKNILDTSESFYDTEGAWVEVELYGRTGEDQNDLTVTLRLGGYSSLNTGYAAFDNVALEKVTALPSGISAVNFMPFDTKEEEQPMEEPSNWENSVGLWFTIGLMFFVISLAVYFVFIKKEGWNGKKRTFAIVFPAMLALSFVLRAALSAVSVGHPTDMGCFSSWAAISADSGILNFYKAASFADYPPGYMYVLYLIGSVCKAVGLTGIPAPLIKLPAMLSDIAIACIIYFAGKNKLGRMPAAILALLFAYVPVIFYNSAVWGQMDSVLMLVMVCALLAYIKKKPILTGVLYAVAVLIKPQALIIAPLALAALIAEFWNLKPQKALLNLAGCLGSFVVVFIAGVLPFCITYNDPLWFAMKYGSTMVSYHYATVNALNFLYLLGGNWQDMSISTDPRGMPLGIPYGVTGGIFFGMALVYTLILYLKARQRPHILHLSALLYVLTFTFGPMMHERYILPAIILLAVSYLYLKDRRILFVAAGFALTAMVNLAYVEQSGDMNQNVFTTLIALTNVVLSASLAYISFEHAFWRKTQRMRLSVKEENK